MTRINAGIPVLELTQKHLIAEHREITRIPNAIRNGKFHMKDIPTQFKLGIGHVRFFYDKLLYLKNRYIEIYNECKLRGYNVQNNVDSWDEIPVEFMNNWIPTDEARSLVRARIAIRNLEIQKKFRVQRNYLSILRCYQYKSSQ